MRFDLFIKRGQEWVCYVQAVTKGNAVRMIAALEAEGDSVLACYHRSTMGRMVYQTSDGWNFRKAA